MSYTDLKLLSFLHKLYRFQSTTALAEMICQELPDLIGGENTIICTHDGSQKVITSVIAKHAFSCANLMPHINETGIMAQHPFWEDIFDENRRVRSLSDVISKKDWHRNPLYNEVFAPDGIEDQINVEIFGNAERFTTIGVLRSRRGFSSEDKELYNLLRPHFTQAFLNAGLAEKSGLVHKISENSWIIHVDHKGKILMKDQDILPQIAFRFGTNGRFPEKVERWVTEKAIRLNQGLLDTLIAPLTFSHQGQIWTFTLHRDFGFNRYILSVQLKTECAQPCSLTARETEILHWVSEGKSNQEIAAILDLSIHTVKTHLKRSFLKLGVENRTAAVAACRKKSAR
jgi:DNA-binding CsgD family transcriptional regulator